MMMNMGEGEREYSWVEFPGHIWIAAVFVLFGTFVLLLTLKYCKELQPGETFCQKCVPYRDVVILRGIGKLLVTVTIAGFFYHAAGDGLDGAMYLHMSLYTCFFFIGVVVLLESHGRLPPDSGRAALALVMFLGFFLWHAHGVQMLTDGMNNVMSVVHIYVGYINLVGGVTFAYSVMHPDSIIAHLMAWGLLVLQGTWIGTIAFYLCCFDMDEHMVEAYLCLQAILVSLTIVLVIGLSDLPTRNDWLENGNRRHHDNRGEYDVLMAKHSEGTTDTVGSGSDDEYDLPSP